MIPYSLRMTCVLVVALGCSPSSINETPESKSKLPADLPPLRVVVVDAEEIEADLGLRWQTSFEQPISVTRMQADEFLNGEPSSVDVIIYPATLMGTLVQRNWIATVPRAILEPKRPDSPAAESEPTRESTVVSSWPTRWKQVSHFGGKCYAIPLGSPSLAAIARGLDCTKLVELRSTIVSNRNMSESNTKWIAFLDSAEAELKDGQAERENQLSSLLGDLTEEGTLNLVDRFLWIVATTDSRSGGLFDLYKAQARLHLPDFIESSVILARLARLSPSTIFAEPEESWDQVVMGHAPFAIGWPRTDGKDLEGTNARVTERSAKKRTQVLPLLWSNGRGLMVSMGRKTRQSYASAEFMRWIDSNEQRSALHLLTARIELAENSDDRNFVREDFREYQQTQELESAVSMVDLVPRFARSETYLKSLGHALVGVLKNPDAAQQEMAACKKAWDAISAENGTDVLRTNLELSTGRGR